MNCFLTRKSVPMKESIAQNSAPSGKNESIDKIMRNEKNK